MRSLDLASIASAKSSFGPLGPATPERIWTIVPAPDSGWAVFTSQPPLRRVFPSRLEAVRFAHTQIQHGRSGRIRFVPAHTGR